MAATELESRGSSTSARARVRARVPAPSRPSPGTRARSARWPRPDVRRAGGRQIQRALIVNAPPRAVVGRATASSASASSNARARDVGRKRRALQRAAGDDARGAARRRRRLCTDAERVALPLHRPGSRRCSCCATACCTARASSRIYMYLGVLARRGKGGATVFGAGDNVLRLCHARKRARPGVVRVAATARRSPGHAERRRGVAGGLRVMAFSGADAVPATKTAAAQAEKSRGSRWTPRCGRCSTPSLPSSPPRVLGVCDAYGQTDTPPMTQIEIASRIASAFETNIRRFPDVREPGCSSSEPRRLGRSRTPRARPRRA